MNQNTPTQTLLDALDRALDGNVGTGGRSGLTRWAVLAVAVLGTAGLFALPLAFGRAPGISDYFPYFVANFHRFLVVHVDYSFVVFFLCVFAAVAYLSVYRISNGKPRFGFLEKLSFGLTLIAVAGMFLPVLPISEDIMARFPILIGEPIMSNYVPVLTSPLFYASLLILSIAMALMSVWVLVNIRDNTQIDVFSLGGVTASLLYLVAFVHFMQAWWLLADAPNTHQFNEDLFWAGGHVLQFVNMALLITAWYATSATVLGRTPFNPKSVSSASMVLGLGGIATIVFSSWFTVFGGSWRMAFTDLQYMFAIIGLLVAVPMAKTIFTLPIKPWKNPGYVVLVLSPIVFAIGGIMGLFVDGQDTRTPAHYHAMIAGITLSFMGLFYMVFLPLMSRVITHPRLALISVWMFGISQAVASSGLFLAGGHGTQRKVAGADQGLTAFTAKLGMGLNGGAGLLAIIGGALFVWVIATAILNKSRQP